MFSRSKPHDTSPTTSPSTETGKDMDKTATTSPRPAETGYSPESPASGGQDKPKASPSLLSSDLTVKGNLITSGDVQVEGTVEGDIHAHLLTVGEGATVKGEVVADDVVVHGRVVGRLRGLKVRLTASAKVEGDIVHKTIAIESGAHFEGSVQRQEDPIGDTARRSGTASAASAGSAASSSSGSASSGDSSATRQRSDSREPATAGASASGNSSSTSR